MPDKNFWENRNVLVTGATGILGAWLTKSLVEKGSNVIVIQRDVVPKSNFYLLGLDKKVFRVNGDIIDYSIVERAFNEYEIDICFHLGAQTIVGTANRSPLSTFESNIKGTWTILETARNSKLIERIIVASSDKAYGSSAKLPYKEDAELKGLHPYDCSKTCADLLAQTYYHTYQLPVGILRCGNIYGGGDLNFNRIVPGTIKSILFNKPVIIRSDGKFIRDYVYVNDAVDAYIMLAEKLTENLYGEAFNFGNDKPVSVIEIVNKIIKISGKKDVEVTILNQPIKEIREQYLDSQKARDMLGWGPRYSLEQGLIETYDWYKAFFSK